MPDPVPPPTVTLVSPEGKATDVPSDQVQAYTDRGFTQQDVTGRASQVAADTVAAHTSTAKSVAYGLARGVTFGLSDTLLSPTEKIDAQDAQSLHPIASLGGNLAGALLTGGATLGKLGAATGDALGGGILARAAGGAVEGAGFGAGNAVSELALSDDPLTAEHIASTLSSNLLLGGAIGGLAGAGSEFVQRGLQRAGGKLAEASAAKAAIEGVPEDLAGLDDKGLGDAFAAAKGDHAADVTAEKQSLEGLRVNQRAELANQVQDLHEDLATERPIFTALSDGADNVNPALKGIDDVGDARVQLAKSFKSMRAAFDSPLSVQRDPMALVRPLEQRQAALETLQQRMPEMQAAMAGDSRVEVLTHVDDALEQTKAQIAAIRELKTAPLASARLTSLEAGPSARMQQITAARDALKTAPELGLLGKGAKAGAFAGGTALAHMIPGVGLAAPFIGKAASDAVGKLFERAATTVGKVSEQASGAATKFLAAAKTLEPYAAPVASKTLSTVRFGAEASSKVDTGSELGDLYRARSGELLQQTQRMPDGTTQMRPDARASMAAKLDPIRQVNPVLADKIETVKARATAYLAAAVPKRPDAPALQVGPDTWSPSELEIRGWARKVRAVEDPAGVEERLARGIMTPQEADAYRTVYPERFAALQAEIFQAAPTLAKTLPRSKQVALSIFTGVPVAVSMRPEITKLLQQTFAVEPGSAGGTQAPRPQPNFGKLGSLKDIDKPTPSQERHQ